MRAPKKCFRPLAVGLCLFSALACSRDGANEAPASGFVLISASALRADALGWQGRAPSVTPFLDQLVQRALVFERAYTTSPDTLAAHVSLMSGLYPAEHRVAPPERTLSAEVPVLAELFGESGYRTAGFTSGGYVSSDFGFDRGFDRFVTSRPGGKSPFDRAARFLRAASSDRFFVLVHTDSIEESLMARFDLRRLAAGNEPVTDSLARSVEAEYLQAVARLDRELEAFFEDLESLGLAERTVVALTADHGFEWGEHGRIGHVQVYPETLAVPLIILGPGIEPSRQESLAQIVDVAPSLAALAELRTPPFRGAVLRGLPDRIAAREPRSWAVARALGRLDQETLLWDQQGISTQLVESRLRGEHDGTWVTRKVTFDTRLERLDFGVVSFADRRTLRLLDGPEVVSELEVGPRWSSESVSLSAGATRKRLTLEADDCVSPSDLDMGLDRRCLSFKVRGLDLSRLELFDLESDPKARGDLSWQRPALTERLQRQLDQALWAEGPPPGRTTPRATTLAAITVRGEYPEPPHR